MDVKKCVICLEVKSKAEFGMHRSTTDGLLKRCKTCENDIQKKLDETRRKGAAELRYKLDKITKENERLRDQNSSLYNLNFHLQSTLIQYVVDKNNAEIVPNGSICPLPCCSQSVETITQNLSGESPIFYHETNPFITNGNPFVQFNDPVIDLTPDITVDPFSDLLKDMNNLPVLEQPLPILYVPDESDSPPQYDFVDYDGISIDELLSYDNEFTHVNKRMRF
jgi:hypothetical protein